VNIVGFAVDDERLKEEFEEWARIGGGRFFDAAGADELGDAIAAALQPPFEVRDTAGAVIGSGVVDGDAERVPPGNLYCRDPLGSTARLPRRRGHQWGRARVVARGHWLSTWAERCSSR
jgi:hypothetical protein